MEQRISVIGLGKLGCSMMACFVHKGWQVIGLDVNDFTVETIKQGRSPIDEPRVEEMLKENAKRITVTTDYETAILNSDVSFIIVPTPSKEDGSFSTEYVEAAAMKIAKVLAVKNTYHLIVITSTVLPGDSLRIAYKVAAESGKKLGVDFGVVYNPDFIALGKIVFDFLNPDIILIGECDERAGDIIEDIHKKLIDNSPTIHRMNFYNAELAKISLNAYCTLKITFANVIAEICEKLPGGDAEQVLKAVGSDSRVGNKYFRGGLGFSGPCFPRDNRALAYSARFCGTMHFFCELTDAINNYHKTKRICDLLFNYMGDRGVKSLAILGLSYKEDTSIIEESVSISVIEYFSKEGITINVYDPVAMENTKEAFEGYNNITYTSSEYDCIRDMSVCFIATPWPQFRDIDSKKVVKKMKKDSIILDAWGVLPYEYAIEKEKVVEIRRLGKNYL